MALIRCPECGRDISSSAKICPQCGCEVIPLIKNRFQIQFMKHGSGSDETVYSFEHYPQNGNIGVLLLNQINSLADYRVKDDVLFIIYKGEESKYLLTTFGFVEYGKGISIPDGELIDYTIHNVPDDFNRRISITFKKDGIGIANGHPMKYYRTENFMILQGKYDNGTYFVRRYAKYMGMWYCGFYANMGFNGQEALVGEYNELIMYYMNNIKVRDVTGYKREVQLNTVRCPYCNSYNTKKVGFFSRTFSTGVLGLGSSKIGKQWHCRRCGSDF